MKRAGDKERKAFIAGILSVIHNAEGASAKAIIQFTPYIEEKGRSLPFLCETEEDYSIAASEDEYQSFLVDLHNKLYPSYFTPKMDFTKALHALLDCILNENFVAYDYASFIIKSCNENEGDERLADAVRRTLEKCNTRGVLSDTVKSKGDASYFAHQLYSEIKKKVGLRSETLSK